MTSAPISDSVLVIDDDVSFHRLVESIFKPTGIPVVAVRTGEQALKLLGDVPPRGVLIDGLLPGIRGDDVALQLRRAWPKDQLPIVFVSAFFRDLKSRTHLLKTCQVDVVLHKPMTADELKLALARIPSLQPKALPVLERDAAAAELPLGTGAEMIAEYVAISQERVGAMRAALANLGGPGRATALRALQTEAHRFRGSGASYGLPELSRLGAQIEDLLKAQPEGDIRPWAQAQLTGLVDALRAKVARSGATVAIETVAPGDRLPPLDLVVVDGPGELALSCSEAAGAGEPIRIFADPAAAVASAIEERPAAVLVSLDRREYDGLSVVEKLAAAGLQPIIAMSRESDLGRRRMAFRAGAQGFTFPLTDAEACVRIARELLPTTSGLRVVALGEDVAALGSLAEGLATARIDVEPCTDAASLFPVLERSAPAGVLVDLDGLGASGLEPLRLMRADPRHRRLPLVALSKREAGEEGGDHVAALEAGAELVVRLPCPPAELALRLRPLLARHFREERDSQLDPLTGAYTRSYLEDACRRALRLARRGRTLAMLVFDCELGAIREAKGRFAADEVLTALAARLMRAFRVSDVVARIGEDRFAALLYDLTRVDAQRILNANLEGFKAVALGTGLSATVRGGLAFFPEVEGDCDALIGAAAEHLA